MREAMGAKGLNVVGRARHPDYADRACAHHARSGRDYRLGCAMREMSRRQRGVTMVESLVALVVLSVGMLGIASLYVSSLKAERTALIRTQAVNLVSDMADRIRANIPAGVAYSVAKYSGAPKKYGCVAGTENCSIAELAEDDLARWLDLVKTGGLGALALPGTPTKPKATVEFTPATGAGLPDRYRIAVAWREPGDTSDLIYENTLEIIPGKP